MPWMSFVDTISAAQVSLVHAQATVCDLKKKIQELYTDQQ